LGQNRKRFFPLAIDYILENQVIQIRPALGVLASLEREGIIAIGLAGGFS
jgi:hypothetical protein